MAKKEVKTENSKVIMLTPDGVTFKQAVAYDLSKEKQQVALEEIIYVLYEREVKANE